MPKIVDVDQRRSDIFDAVFQIIERDGIAAATLGRVATESGLAIGSVRHFLGSHGDMLEAAADMVVRRISARLESHLPPLLDAVGRGEDVRDGVLTMLFELLPLDEVRRRETAVWLEFVMAARTVPESEDHSRKMFSGTRTLTGRISDRLGLPPLAGERLAAAVDGLALVGTLHPTLMSPDLARSVLGAELDALLAERVRDQQRKT